MVDVACEPDEAAKWLAALAPLSGGEGAGGGDFLRQGWLTRDKKKFYFTLRGGYLTWYNKVGRLRRVFVPLPSFTTTTTIIVALLTCRACPAGAQCEHSAQQKLCQGADAQRLHGRRHGRQQH